MSSWHSNNLPHRRLHSGDRGEDVKRFQVGLKARTGLPVAADGILGQGTLTAWRVARHTGGLPEGHPLTAGAQLNIRRPWTRTPAAFKRAKDRAMSPKLGARGMVERAVQLARIAHPELFVVSDFRPGDPMDHGSNDFDKAARDIGHPAFDALKGPPHPFLDDAAVVIGKAFGRDYEHGKRVVDTFTWHDFRVQLIWKTPEFGGHMGHNHLGIREF